MFALKKPALALLFGLLTGPLCLAGGVLKIGVTDADAPPIVELAADGHTLRGGLSRELGDALAAQLHMTPEYQVLARKRIEPMVESGRIHIVCNANPEWYGNATRLLWSHELYPQVERAISLHDLPDIHKAEELEGKRIGTIFGYNYPTLERLWASGRSSRVEEAKQELLLKSLQKQLTNVAINSELEFAWWARNHPHDAHDFKLHPLVVTSMPTMCAVSPHAPLSLARLNQAIDSLHRRGTLQAILKRYQWQAR